MPNFKLSVDLADLQNELTVFDLRDYRLPFCLYFIEADNPDDACSTIMMRLMRLILKEKCNLETRILCRKIRRYMRIDKIECL
tara:strand:- start:320 stop:568 length:249 start_codon:yes stop_codon:yes gene_type:complete